MESDPDWPDSQSDDNEDTTETNTDLSNTESQVEGGNKMKTIFTARVTGFRVQEMCYSYNFFALEREGGP